MGSLHMKYEFIVDTQIIFYEYEIHKRVTFALCLYISIKRKKEEMQIAVVGRIEKNRRDC
jgi:hypothetical protein